MKLTDEKKAELFYSKDLHSDGKFIVGVLTTGIYCLPSCSARKPKRENIRFFDKETDAADFGLRPCKRCRPDLYYKKINPDEVLVEEAYALINDYPAKWDSIEQLAKALQVGKTKLSKLFRDYYQISYGTLLQQARINSACGLLLDSDKNLLEIAELAGYENQSTFFANFRDVNGMSPGDYRKLKSSGSFTIHLPEDYRSDLLIRHHSWEGDGPDHKLEVDDGIITITKAITLDSARFILQVTLNNQTAKCHILEATFGEPPMAEVHDIARKLLGLTVNPTRFETRMLAKPRFAPLVEKHAGMRIPQTATLYEGIVWVIVGQAVSLAAAKSLRTKLIHLAGSKSKYGLLYHPCPADVAKLSLDDLRSCGLSNNKSNFLTDITAKILSNELRLDKLHEINSVKLEKELTSLRGFGPWSVNYLMMRCLGKVDCVPLGDTGLVSGLQKYFNLKKKPDRKEVVRLMEQFRPYRSLATFHLWMGAGE